LASQLGAVSISLVLAQPLLQDFDCWEEVVALADQQVDVVEVFAAAEAVGKVVTRIDGGPQFLAVGTVETPPRVCDANSHGSLGPHPARLWRCSGSNESFEHQRFDYERQSWIRSSKELLNTKKYWS
jgi:hypothetical protein